MKCSVSGLGGKCQECRGEVEAVGCFLRCLGCGYLWLVATPEGSLTKAGEEVADCFVIWEIEELPMKS